jgi:hypothetical protein
MKTGWRYIAPPTDGDDDWLDDYDGEYSADGKYWFYFAANGKKFANSHQQYRGYQKFHPHEISKPWRSVERQEIQRTGRSGFRVHKIVEYHSEVSIAWQSHIFVILYSSVCGSKDKITLFSQRPSRWVEVICHQSVLFRPIDKFTLGYDEVCQSIIHAYHYPSVVIVK